MDILVVSAFCKDNEGGNRAGVVIGHPELTGTEKMAIAERLGYSETAFVTESDRADFRLEYFTPTEEVPLCGHATIGAFSGMFLQGMIPPGDYRMETKAGILRVKVSENGHIQMEQNAPGYGELLPWDEMALCFPGGDFRKDLPVRIVSTGLRDVLLPVTSKDALSALKPDFEAMKEMSRRRDVVGVHAFVLTEGESTAVCRNFAPLYGIDEESATGTSNCALACYLWNLGMKKEHYVFEQGYELGLPSRITVDLKGEDAVTEVMAGGFGYMVEILEW